MAVNMRNKLLNMKISVYKFFKSFYQKKMHQQRATIYSPLALPQLPPEVWAIVIGFATLCTPDPLDVTQPLSFLSSRHCKLQDYGATMQTKQNLCLVSQGWHELTRPYLYEFVWICRSRQAAALALTLLMEKDISHETMAAATVKVRRSSGYYIRRLHIETLRLERCNPTHLRTILDYAPALVSYSDCRSVRRGRADMCDPCCSSEEIFSALAHPNNNLRRLSWTNYDTDASFSLHISPMLQTTAASLEYLELTVCSPHFPSIFSDIVHAAAPASLTTMPSVTLPALLSLKVTLHNSTFAMLSNWSFPQLTNLSVVSADFSYAGTGFTEFFRVHGPKISQLELGHSSFMIEEHYLTAPPAQPAISLGEFCPNLKEFVCSADVEWYRMNPQWVAPHVLLPRHPTLRLIGVKDINKRLIDDAEIFPLTSYRRDDFFLLSTQFSSLLNAQAFPQLRYIRDLSYESHTMRKRCVEERLMRFWMAVLGMCKERGVWLEDYEGVNVTRGALRRAYMEANGGVETIAIRDIW